MWCQSSPPCLLSLTSLRVRMISGLSWSPSWRARARRRHSAVWRDWQAGHTQHSQPGQTGERGESNPSSSPQSRHWVCRLRPTTNTGQSSRITSRAEMSALATRLLPPVCNHHHNDNDDHDYDHDGPTSTLGQISHFSLSGVSTSILALDVGLD